MDWIFEFNARPWFEAVAHVIGSPFDDGDWDAVEKGYSRAGGTPFEYQFKGPEGVLVTVIWDSPPDVVHVRAATSKQLDPAIKLATFMCQQFVVRRHTEQVLR
jgi:hypothetical protein